MINGFAVKGEPRVWDAVGGLCFRSTKLVLMLITSFEQVRVPERFRRQVKHEPQPWY